MEEETIYDPKEVKQNPVNNGQMEESIMENDAMHEPFFEDGKKKKSLGNAGAAGLGGAAGAALGVLIPKLVFPNSVEEDAGTNEEQTGEGELNEVEVPNLSGHLTGHDMDVATGVDDSMSFNQAFAAARHEVGPGGLFVWHGNTYGTYYANEWNAMSPDDKAQYWADVSHSTSHLNSEPEPEPNPEQPLKDPNQLADNKESDDNNENPVDEGKTDVVNDDVEEPQPHTSPDEDGNIADNGGDDGETSPVDDPEMPEVLVDGLADNGEDIPSVETPETLVLNEEDVIAEFDLDGDGIADAGFVDANGNEIVDVVLDTTGDGSYDTLVIDPQVDDDGNLVVADENILEIGGVEVATVESDEGLIMDDSETRDELLPDDVVDDNIIAESPDVDDFASLTPDPDVTIDNNMDMSDFA